MIKEQFISEAIEPATDAFDSSCTEIGAPCLPLEFTWRGKPIRITQIRKTWKETGPCRHGSGEQYVRKHWYEVVTETGTILRIYFNRQPKGGRKAARWWLFTVCKK